MSPGLRAFLGLGKRGGDEHKDEDDAGDDGRREAMRDRARQLV